MSFFSWSKKKHKKYKYDKYGNRHYQRKGLLGKILHVIKSSSYSNKNYNPNRYQRYQNYVPIHQRPNLKQTVGCNKCNAKIPAGSKFCLECGEQVVTTIFCSNCRETLPNGAKFCSNCGTKTNN